MFLYVGSERRYEVSDLFLLHVFPLNLLQQLLQPFALFLQLALLVYYRGGLVWVKPLLWHNLCRKIVFLNRCRLHTICKQAGPDQQISLFHLLLLRVRLVS